MPKKKKEVQRDKSQDQKLFAFIATFFSILGFVFALAAKRDDDYIMFYAKQSFVVFIFIAIAGLLRMFTSWMPIIGTIISLGLGILAFVAWLLSWLYALSGQKQEVPIIGVYARNFKF